MNKAKSMLTLLRHWQQKDLTNTDESEETQQEPQSQLSYQQPIAEDVLKKRIANKLRRYQPLKRQSNFTGPRYHG